MSLFILKTSQFYTKKLVPYTKLEAAVQQTGMLLLLLNSFQRFFPLKKRRLCYQVFCICLSVCQFFMNHEIHNIFMVYTYAGKNQNLVHF